MSHFVVIRHKVRDYASWKVGYDNHSARAQAGLSTLHVLRNADDPNEVVIVMQAEDIDRARAFGASAGLRETMQKVGVTDHPDVYFLKD